MAFRFGNRQQTTLLPPCINSYVDESDPVRVYDAFVEALDFSLLGISLDANKVGNSSFNPKSMLKLLLYGYSYGIRSSRKLERATRHNLSFIWLIEGLEPDHNTISRFRKDNLSGLKKVLKQCARLCLKLGLVEGNTLFLDGTKIRANASIKNTWKEVRCDKSLVKIDKRIAEILKECELADQAEAGTSSLVELKAELTDKENLKSKVKSILDELKRENKSSVNTTDKDCVVVKSRQGTHAAYNGQIVVDDKNSLIVNSDVVSEANDLNQFSNQINQAQDTLEKHCNTAVGDAGYANTDNLAELDKAEVKVIVPSQKQQSKQPDTPFSKLKFRYDEEKDCYWCPKGEALKYSTFEKEYNRNVYRINSRVKCKLCSNFGKCTTAQKGRSIKRLINEKIKEKLEKQYLEKSCQDIYKKRQEKVEHPFGHIKRNLGVQAFLLRGIEAVKAEMGIFSTNFNISRMITILGIEKILQELKAI